MVQSHELDSFEDLWNNEIYTSYTFFLIFDMFLFQATYSTLLEIIYLLIPYWSLVGFLMYFFNTVSSSSTLSEDTGIEPRTLALALVVQTTRLDLILLIRLLSVIGQSLRCPDLNEWRQNPVNWFVVGGIYWRSLATNRMSSISKNACKNLCLIFLSMQPKIFNTISASWFNFRSSNNVHSWGYTFNYSHCKH